MRGMLGIGFVLCLVAPGAKAAGDVTLVEKGASGYTIVRPASSSPSQVYAAEELRDVVKEMTGAELPIATDEGELPPKAILLGSTRHSERILGESVNLAGLGDDGFRLCVRSPHVLVLGSGVRGTLYGVYELLETYGGCRWYASFFGDIPKKATLTIPIVDDTQTPAFVMREPFWWDMFEGDFAARSRANGNRPNLKEKHGGKIRFGSGMFVHTFYRLMPPSEFFDEHPEYYSEIDGKRQADRGQLCLTNPDVLRIVTERTLEKIRKDPTAKLFSVSQNDWRGNCTCPACKAIDDREGSPAGTMITFCNKVAEAVEKEFPDVWIETLAYQYMRHPPKTVRPRHNVVPRLCSIECDFSLPLDVSTYKQNVSFVDDMKGWSAISDKLYVWDYVTNFRHYIGPHPNFACLQPNVKFFRDNKVVGLFEQGAYQSKHAEFAELRAWILAKLLWNPERDLEALYKDFFEGYYGPAAPIVRTYFDELQALTQPQEHVLRIFMGMKEKWYTDEFFDRAAGLWADAERAAAGTKYEYNVRMGAIPVWYIRLQRQREPAGKWTWEDGRLKRVIDDASYVALARELLARIREGKITHAAENKSVNNAFMNKVRCCTEGFETVEVKGGDIVAGLVPQVGGRVCMLRKGDGPNCLSPSDGGIDFSVNSRNLLGFDTTVFDLKKNADGVASLDWHYHWVHHKLHREVQAGGDGLTVRTDVTSTRTEPQTIRPVARVALDLGDAASVAVRTPDGEWQNWALAAGALGGTSTLPGDSLRGAELLVASAATNRGVRLRLPDIALERICGVRDSRSGSVQMIVLGEQVELPGRGTLSCAVTVDPIPAVADVPAIVRPQASEEQGGIVAEDWLFSIGKYGTWGEIVRDGKASDGFAAKLFNTHYEWCLQWRFDPRWFEAGATYRLEVRARIDSIGRDGEAFWTGVYDTGRKKGWCQIQPTTADVKDGYAWYVVGEWVPENEQYVWAGPGRFDKEGGAESAIGALYIDCFRMTKVK